MNPDLLARPPKPVLMDSPELFQTCVDADLRDAVPGLQCRQVAGLPDTRH